MHDEMKQYLDIFIQEAKEQLEIITQSLIKLEKDPGNRDLVNEIFRAAHTLKGSSGMMGFTKIQKLTHKMEDIFDGIRKGLIHPSPDLIDVLFECIDALERKIDQIENGKVKEEDENTFLYLIERLESIVKKEDHIKKEVSVPPLDREELRTLENYIKSIGDISKCFFLTIKVDESCPLKSARLYQVVLALEKIGKILRCFPDIKRIEKGDFDGTMLNVVLMSECEKEKIEEIMNNISEISGFEVKRLKEIFQEKALEGLTDSPRNNKIPIHSKPKLKADFGTVQTVRVRREDLDKLMNLVGELIISKIHLSKLVSEHKLDFLKNILDNIDRLTFDLQDLVMRIRMVPIGHIFNRFPRLVRDMARKLGKKVNFVVKGKEIEVDRTVLDEIGEPILHLLRNAIDHGIEPPEIRKRNGKPEEGVVKLIAERRRDHILIIVEDDGAGLDPEKIKMKALEKGIISEAEANVMTARQLIDLIFLPGFSTAEKVTELSGRGVGMDVVKTKIESLGGTIQIESSVGKGTKVTLKLPLTLAIVKALLIKVVNQLYAIPLSQVAEIIKVKKSELKKIGDVEAINLRGKVLPIFRLRRLLGYPQIESENYIAIVINREPVNFGLIVDSVEGMQEIVIKSLDERLKRIDGVAGVTILGDGKVVLILDPIALIRRKRKAKITQVLL
ncbi:MAG: chemotaxis protein CheA [archaeon GB-1867-005]|nr:chemotaxis protein CheA [Candidatus Culexmicrobium cathedralense]